MSSPRPTHPKTYLQIVEACDNFRPTSSSETLLTWCLTSEPSSPAIGLLRPPVVLQLLEENKREAAWEFTSRSDGRQIVCFASWVATSAQRTRIMKEMCERWRDQGLWPGIIGPQKWRGEMYPVYHDPFGYHDAPTEDVDVAHASGDRDADVGRKNYAFMMERSACSLFGVVTYGVHMSIYEEIQPSPDGRPTCRIWVPTRSRTKQTWPGYLDNSIAGGIPCGMKAFDSLVKESMEEGSIAEDVVRKHARAAGSITYYSRTDAGWLHPEVQYIYDLRVPPDGDPVAFQPKPLDGEVEAFELLTLDEIVPRMRTGLFKRNCALVILDFMLRHGYLTAEEEPDFLKIMTRLHGDFEYEKW